MAKKNNREIWRHEPSDKGDDKVTFLSEASMEAITKHVTKHAGKIPLVWHEILSDRIHVDILPTVPSPKRPFKTLVTMGMSALPMTVPDEYEGPDRLELCVVLPPDWHLDDKEITLKDKRYEWPIRGLKTLARLPFDYDTFLGIGHTVPMSDPPAPFAKSCNFVCWMGVPPLVFGDNFDAVETDDGIVGFLQLVPLYREEMDYVLEHDSAKLFSKFEKMQLDPAMMCDPNRPNACATKKKR